MLSSHLHLWALERCGFWCCNIHFLLTCNLHLANTRGTIINCKQNKSLSRKLFSSMFYKNHQNRAVTRKSPRDPRLPRSLTEAPLLFQLIPFPIWQHFAPEIRLKRSVIRFWAWEKVNFSRCWFFIEFSLHLSHFHVRYKKLWFSF